METTLQPSRMLSRMPSQGLLCGSPKLGWTVGDTALPCCPRPTLLSDWLRASPKMHDEDSGVDPAPDSPPWRDHVFCPHGGLQPRMNDRKMIGAGPYAVLRGLYPKWQSIPVDQPKCAQCASPTDQLDEEGISALALTEKSTLITLGRDMHRTQMGPKEATQSFAPVLYLAPRGTFRFVWRSAILI